MGMLSATDLLLARETAAEALDGTAVYGGGTFVSDGGGGGTTTFVAAGTVACRVAPIAAGEGEKVVAERLHPDSEVVFTFPAGTPVTHNSQILYGGGTFSVTAVRQRSVEITRRVEAKGIE